MVAVETRDDYKDGPAGKLVIADRTEPPLLFRHNWVRIGILMILAVTCLCYASTLRFGFVYDDISQIVNNPRVHSAHFLPDYFANDAWAHQTGRPQNLYRPLFLVWLLGNFKSFGLQARDWHLLVILMHLLMAFLVYVLASRLLPQKPWAALTATTLFALHPSLVEAVAWISGVTEPLSGVLVLGSLLCYFKSREQRQARIPWITGSLFLGACAMLAKETAVVLPALIVCYEWSLGAERVNEESSRSLRHWLAPLTVAWPYLLVLALYFVLRVSALHGVAHSFSDLPLWRSILAWPWVIYFYISQLLAPVALGPYYDANYVSGLNMVVPLLVLAALTVGVLWWRRKSETKLPLFLASWFLLTLAPVLVLFVMAWRYDNLHDRYLYLPSVAIAILIGHLVAVAEERFSRRRTWLFRAAIMMVLGLLAVSTYRQTSYWKDNLVLHARGVAVAPHNLAARLNLASAYYENQRYGEAFAAAQEALKIDPNSPLALTDVAQAAYYRGDYATADRDYSRALALGPPGVDQVYYLAMARIKTGRYQAALLLLRQGLSRWPNAPGYHAAMGQALAGMGEWAAARDQYKLELKLNPTSKETQDRLAETEGHVSGLPQSR